MNKSKIFMLLGLGLAVGAAAPMIAGAPMINGAMAQSSDQYQSEDQYQSNREGEPDENIWRKPDRNDDRNFDGERRRSRGEFRQRRHRAGFGRGHRRGGRFLNRFDSDGDGSITQAEFDAAMNKRFARLDINGDGTITKQELNQRKRRRWSN